VAADRAPRRTGGWGDFEETFQANDQYDEEAQGAAEFMALMVKHLGGLDGGALEFTAAQVAQLCDEHRYSFGVRPADPTVPDPASLASALAEVSGRAFARGGRQLPRHRAEAPLDRGAAGVGRRRGGQARGDQGSRGQPLPDRARLSALKASQL
jgi:hypothetical protein